MTQKGAWIRPGASMETEVQWYFLGLVQPLYSFTMGVQGHPAAVCRGSGPIGSAGSASASSFSYPDPEDSPGRTGREGPLRKPIRVENVSQGGVPNFPFALKWSDSVRTTM